MLRLPIFDELEGAQNILLAGAGGGFDIFCGLPLYFALRSAGKNVHLANLSFSLLPTPRMVGAERLSPAVLEVTADTPKPANYFPEFYLSQWFRTQGSEVPIYCFERTGVRPLQAAYGRLVDLLSLDTVILVDGGTDSLMRGDEVGLGTPQEDIASIVAVNELPLKRKLLACIGFGIDSFHGVCHAHFLEAVAEIARSGGYLGMFSLLNEMPEAQLYRAACEAVFRSMPHSVSIVSSSILAALAGEYGDHHPTTKTSGSEMWINPLMSAYWSFHLDHVARRILYADEMRNTESYAHVTRVIESFRESCATPRPWKEIPV